MRSVIPSRSWRSFDPPPPPTVVSSVRSSGEEGGVGPAEELEKDSWFGELKLMKNLR